MSDEQQKINEVNEELRKAVDNISTKNRYEKLLKSARNEQNLLKDRVEELKKQLAKEEDDVKKLTQISFSNLLHIILNDKVEKLDIEQREVLEAKLKYEIADTQLKDSMNYIKKLEGEYQNYVNAESEYKILINKKRVLIEEYLPERWHEIEKYLQEDKQLSSQQKEIKEAINAGNMVISQLKQVKSALNSAQNWGTWDMLGGGMISTMAKHEKMQQAQTNINKTQSLLRNFSRELGDIDSYINIDLNISSFLGFADYFFDGFFVDWTVQSKIHSAQDKVDSTYNKAKGIIDNLKIQFSQINNKKLDIEYRVQTIIEQI